MRYWVRRRIGKIRRLARYIPVLWKSEDWDYVYAVELFRMKLEDISVYLKDHGECEREVDQSSRIDMIVRLMKKVYDEEYLLEYRNIIEAEFGKSTLDMVKSDDGFYEVVFSVNGINVNDIEGYNKRLGELSNTSSEKQKKAHSLLWKLIDHNIQNWWT